MPAKKKAADAPSTRAERRAARTPGVRIDVANVNQYVVGVGGRKSAKAASADKADTPS